MVSPLISEMAKLDQERLTELLELESDEPGLFIELYDIFCSESNKRLYAMSEALEQVDRGAIEQSAHAFCSTCYNVAATNLATAVKNLELKARETKAGREELSSRFQEIAQAAKEVRTVFAKKLSEVSR